MPLMSPRGTAASANEARARRTRRIAVTLSAALMVVGIRAVAETSEHAQRRQAMVDTVVGQIEATARRTGVTSLSPRVRTAISEVPRHRFVPEAQRARAYQNQPLPIGHGQTISQPYIVALMTELADVAPGQKTLEIGTGSGYQAAVLAASGAKVYSIEIIPELAERASKALQATGYDEAVTHQGDGYHGWTQHAPFQAIVVTAATDHAPPPLIKQLAPGGRMVIPLGDAYTTQLLTVIEKNADGEISSRQVLPVRFVPLTREDP